MKKLALVVAILFVAGLALATAGEAKAAGKTHDVAAEVVSVDLTGKTITIKDEKGENKTAPVKAEALDALKSLKAGDKVILTCQDNEKGEHEAVVKIKKAA